MNKKPSWGLWLLMIVAPVAVFFGINYWKQLPLPLSPQASEMAAQGTPLVGDISLSDDQVKANSHLVFIVLCNPTRDRLSVDFVLESGASELSKHPKGQFPIYRDGSSLVGYSTGNGILKCGIVNINKNRKRPIRLKLHWQTGKRRGVKNVVITPQMNSSNTFQSTY